jgi:hypothetical protein
MDVAGALCQCPCSGDQTLPGGAEPGGWGVSSVDAGVRVLDSVGTSCQCPCSGDQTLPGGAGPGGSEVGTVGD